MHCRRCGKYMESSDELCTPCKAAMFDKMQAQMKAQAQPAQENPFARQAQVQPPQGNPFMQSTYVPPVRQVQDPFAPTGAEKKKKNPRMIGFGGAPAAAILAFVGVLLAAIALATPSLSPVSIATRTFLSRNALTASALVSFKVSAIAKRASTLSSLAKKTIVLPSFSYLFAIASTEESAFLDKDLRLPSV